MADANVETIAAALMAASDELQSHERRLATRSLTLGEAVAWPSSADALAYRPRRSSIRY
jgi:hypothetical protein